MLLITHPVTNLFPEPVASHSAVVLISRVEAFLGRACYLCARPGVCVCVFTLVCDGLCVTFCRVYVRSSIKRHWQAGFIIISYSLFPKSKHPRSMLKLGKTPRKHWPFGSSLPLLSFSCLSRHNNSKIVKICQIQVADVGCNTSLVSCTFGDTWEKHLGNHFKTV